MEDLSSASSAHLLESTTAKNPSKRIGNQKSKAFNDNAKGSTGESALDKAKAKAAEKKKSATPGAKK